MSLGRRSGASREGDGLRGVLLLLAAFAFLVPRSRRSAWLEQWGAELWHYDQWLTREGAGSAASFLRLLARASGAVPHAITIRLLQWSPHMILNDVKFAWRMFVRRRAFTAVAVLILALGIGANTTIFSWTQTVLLSPLSGVADQGRILVVQSATAERDGLSVSYPNFQDLRAAKPDGIADFVAFRLLPMNLRADSEPIRVFGELVSANFFDFFGVRPVLGRGFRADEGLVADRDAVAVISHDLWVRAFAADPSTVGRCVMLNGRSFTIVGIAPADFHGSVAAVVLDIYVPVTMQKALLSGDRLSQRAGGWLEVYARLADGAAARQVQANIGVAGARLVAQYPDANRSRELRAVPLWRAGASSVLLPVLATLMAMVLVVLLIASANLAGLLLASAAARQREIAVRLAVGASRWQVIRQMLVETLLLSAAGCVGGLVFARWAAGLLDAFVPRTPFPLRFDAHIDAYSIMFAMAISIATTIVAGVMPALRASRLQVGVTLKDASPSTAGQAGRVRRMLVVAQVGLSVVLLVCASLFARSLTHSGSMDPGFSLRNGLLASIDLQPAGYDAARGSVFLQQLLDSVSTIPHVTGATVARTMPLDLGGSSDMTVSIDGYAPRDGEEVMAYYNQVGPAYFETMGIPLVQGRGITRHDVAGQPAVAVINETMARRYWPGRDAVGATMRFGSGPVTIVGIAHDGKYSRLSEAPRNYMYLPALQSYRPDLLLHVRTDADAAGVLPAIRAVVHDLDPNLPLFDVRTIDQHMRLSMFIARMAASMLGVFGALGLLLASVGLYGVIAFNATQRTREIGLRMALGAAQQDVAWLVMRQGLALSAIGLTTGLLLAFGAGQVLAKQLVGVSPGDPISFAGTAIVLLLVASLASAIPARRAARLDPLVALRRD
ncbi:MAG TPA: ABC transporter permease [Vicinamibacterales bacterium]|nr:ABC transporter permease [Vicinamibacterales bacterium]